MVETVQIKQCIMGISGKDPIRNVFGFVCFFLFCYGIESVYVIPAYKGIFENFETINW